jgi:hypothetical protein
LAAEAFVAEVAVSEAFTVEAKEVFTVEEVSAGAVSTEEEAKAFMAEDPALPTAPADTLRAHTE